MGFTPLLTERLRLRRILPKDKDLFCAYRASPSVVEFQGAFDENRANALIAEMQTREPGQAGWFQFAIAHKDTDQIVGDIGLHCFESNQDKHSENDPTRCAEIGFTVAKMQQGKGYAFEASNRILGFVFTTLKCERLFAITQDHNTRAQTLLRRLEMQPGPPSDLIHPPMQTHERLYSRSRRDYLARVRGEIV